MVALSFATDYGKPLLLAYPRGTVKIPSTGSNRGKTLAHANVDTRGFLFTLGTSLNSDKERLAMLPRELFLQIDLFTSQGPESTRATMKNNRGFCTLEKLPIETGFTLASAFKTRDVVKLAGNHRAELFKVGLRLVRNLNSDLKAKKAYSVKFFSST